MTYPEAIEFLNRNHFYPKSEVLQGSKTNKILSLQVDCPSILKEDRMKRLEELLGKGWKIEWFGNGHDYIQIKKGK